MAERVSGTLSSGNVTSVALTVPADKTSSYISGTGETETRTIHNRASGVVVTNIGGQAAIYFTIDGSAPSVGGADDFVVAAKAGAQTAAPFRIEDAITVKLISSANTNFYVTFGAGASSSSGADGVKSSTIDRIERLTQAEYDGIATPDPDVFYIIVG